MLDKLQLFFENNGSEIEVLNSECNLIDKNSWEDTYWIEKAKEDHWFLFSLILYIFCIVKQKR